MPSCPSESAWRPFWKSNDANWGPKYLGYLEHLSNGKTSSWWSPSSRDLPRLRAVRSSCTSPCPPPRRSSPTPSPRTTPPPPPLPSSPRSRWPTSSSRWRMIRSHNDTKQIHWSDGHAACRSISDQSSTSTNVKWRLCELFCDFFGPNLTSNKMSGHL